MLPEIAEYLKSLETRRTRIFETLATAPPEAWNWTPTEDETNSLFVLATHSIGSEHGWIYETLGRGAKTRDRAAEFQASGDALDELRSKYAQVGHETGEILGALTNDDLLTTRYRESHGDVSARWIILHVIEHCSEHLGQMELTRQLWEQSKS